MLAAKNYLFHTISTTCKNLRPFSLCFLLTLAFVGCSSPDSNEKLVDSEEEPIELEVCSPESGPPNFQKSSEIEVDMLFEGSLDPLKGKCYSFTLEREQMITVEASAGGEEIYIQIGNETGRIDIGPHLNFKRRTLPPGRYFVDMLVDSTEPVPYTFEIVSTDKPDIQFEPNDTLSEATMFDEVGLNPLHLGYGDPDWFQFDVDDLKLVSIEVKSGDVREIKATLHDEEGELIVTKDPYYDDNREFPPDDEPAQKVLNRGTYYLSVAGNYNFGERLYSLNVEIDDPPDEIYEPNNKASKASQIPIDETLEMYLYSGDQDWFTFNLEYPSVATLGIDLNLTGAEYSLLNEDFSVVEKGEVDDLESLTFSLEAGQYIWGLYAPQVSFDRAYSLRLETTILPDFDLEPNDSFASATTVTLPLNKNLYLSSFEESDWFSWNLSKESYVEFSISIGGNDLGALSVEIYSEGKELLREFGSGRSKGFVFPAGKKWLKVSRCCMGNSGKSYTLTASSSSISDLSYEPNNNKAQAYKIDLDKGFSASNLIVSDGEMYSAYDDDEDWFTFEVTSLSQVVLKIMKAQAADKDISWVLYELKGNSPRYWDDHSSSLPANTYNLPTGTYYIVVANRHSASKYGLSVKRQ